MSTKKSLSSMTAVAFAAALTLSSVAQAGTLQHRGGSVAESPRVERNVGFLNQAALWLGGVVTELKTVFAFDGTTTPPTSTCSGTACPTTDSGWGIDPEG
jgi:hypothetical protein